MHKLYEYACAELKELEKKTDKGLSMSELEYADKLTELKKNILKIEMLEDGSEYSEEHPMHRMSYGRSRTPKRDSRYSMEYSMAADDVIRQLEDMMDTAPDERSRKKIRELIAEMKNV